MAGEIAHAYVQILPTFEGITAKLQAGLGDTDAIGRAAGEKLAASINAGSAGAGAKLAESIGRSVGSASEQAAAAVSRLTDIVTVASDKQAAAVGRVRVAQLALAEAQEKYAAGSSRIAAAEERLATAQRSEAAAAAVASTAMERLATAQDLVATSSAEVTAGVSRGLAGLAARIRDALTSAGRSGGEAAGAEAGDGIRAGILGALAGLGGKMRGEMAVAGRAAGEAAGEDAGEGLRTRLFDNLKDLAAPLLAFFAVDKIAEFFKSSIEAGENVEHTSQLIAQQLKDTNSAAGVSAAGIDKLSTQIGQYAGVARGQILLSEQALLRFGNVRNAPGAGNDIFTRTSKDAADLAAVMHSSVPDAAAILGKALNNPTQGLSRLAKAGVTFTKQQTDQIKAMAQSGHLLDAQRIILAAFEKGYGGAAAAAATSGDKLKASFEDIKEATGQALLPVFATVADLLARVLVPAFNGLQGSLGKTDAFFDRLKESAQPVLDGYLIPAFKNLARLVTSGLLPVLKTLAADFGSIFLVVGKIELGALLTGFRGLASVLGGPITEAFKAVNGFLERHGTLVKSVAVGVAAIVVAMQAWAVVTKVLDGVELAFVAVQTALDTALDANPIGVVVLALAGLAAALIYAYKHSQTFRDIVQGALDGVRVAAEAVADFFSGPFAEFFVKSFEKVKSLISDLTSFVRSHFAEFVALIGGPIGITVLEVAKHWSALKAGVLDAFTVVKDTVERLLRPVVAFIDDQVSLIREYFAHLAALPGQVGGYFHDAVQVVHSRLDDMVGLARALWGRIETAIVGLGRFELAIATYFAHGVSAAAHQIALLVGDAGAIAGRVLRAVGNLEIVLVSKGADLIVGLIHGFTGEYQTLAHYVGGLASTVAHDVGDLSGILYGAGQSVVQGLINGIESMIKALENEIGKLLGKLPHIPGVSGSLALTGSGPLDVPSYTTGAPTLSLSTGSAAGTAASRITNYNVTGNDPRTVVQLIQVHEKQQAALNAHLVGIS